MCNYVKFNIEFRDNDWNENKSKYNLQVLLIIIEKYFDRNRLIEFYVHSLIVENS